MADCRIWTEPLRALLRQGADLAGTLDVESFAQLQPLAPGGSIGAHLRHVGDFVRALLRDLEQGAIDYDRRERDERLETDPARARDWFGTLEQRVERLASLDAQLPLRVRSEALGGDLWQDSSLARELAMLFSHSVHHYALVAVLLRARGLEPPADLGVAPSTLAHWREESTSCAPPAG